MLKLGFTMEELMFPENYQCSLLFNIESNDFRDKLSKISPIYDCQDLITMEDIDDNDDWFTFKQLNPEISLDYSVNKIVINDETLSIFNKFSSNDDPDQVQSMFEFHNNSNTLLPLNSPSQITDDKNCKSLSLSLDTMVISSSVLACDQQQSIKTPTIIQQKKQQQSKKYMMSKSMSSLSFCTQSSTSMTSNSTDDISSNSNDVNEFITLYPSNEHVQKTSDHHEHNRSISDNALHYCNRRRRKRTIFSPTDIEHLKDAFIHNPKPSQQDIAILSEQLGHDAYVIRVWFYNKRQATKKQNG